MVKIQMSSTTYFQYITGNSSICSKAPPATPWQNGKSTLNSNVKILLRKFLRIKKFSYAINLTCIPCSFVKFLAPLDHLFENDLKKKTINCMQ